MRSVRKGQMLRASRELDQRILQQLLPAARVSQPLASLSPRPSFLSQPANMLHFELPTLSVRQSVMNGIQALLSFRRNTKPPPVSPLSLATPPPSLFTNDLDTVMAYDMMSWCFGMRQDACCIFIHISQKLALPRGRDRHRVM